MTSAQSRMVRGRPSMRRMQDTLEITVDQLAALTQAFEHMPQLIMVTDQTGTIEYVNRIFEAKSGYARREVVGKPASILRSDRHDGEFFDRLWTTIQRGKVFRDVFINRRKDGTLFHEYLTISPIRDVHGRIAYFVATGTDATRRVHRNSDLLRQMRAFQIFAANFPGIVYRVNLRRKGKVQVLSNRATSFIGQAGIETAADSGFCMYPLMSPEDRERRQASVDSSVRHNTPFELEYRIQCLDGEIGYCLEYGMPVRDPDGRPSDIYGVVLDISERRRLQKDLQESEHALSELSAKLLTLQEDERKRIARELHDGIGQILTSIKMRVETASSILSRHGFEPGSEVLRAVVPMIQEAMQEVRSMSKDLRPPILDDLGIVATIVWFCRNFPNTYGTVRVEIDIDVDEASVPAALKTAMYRVLQEAMNNVAKHAGASLVRVRLLRLPTGIELIIEDNGCGFDLQEMPSGRLRGIGLASMQERVKMSGGDFSIRSAQRIGTVVRAAWPIGGTSQGAP